LQAVANGSVYHLQRPNAIVFQAKPSFLKQYLSAYQTPVTQAYVGIISIPIYVFHYLDPEIGVVQNENVSSQTLRVGAAITSVGVFLIVATAVGV